MSRIFRRINNLNSEVARGLRGGGWGENIAEVRGQGIRQEGGKKGLVCPSLGPQWAGERVCRWEMEKNRDHQLQVIL